LKTKELRGRFEAFVIARMGMPSPKGGLAPPAARGAALGLLSRQLPGVLFYSVPAALGCRDPESANFPAQFLTDLDALSAVFRRNWALFRQILLKFDGSF
jgi:hypothetical protein